MEYKDYEFNGKTYHCRVVEDKDGEELVIGGTDFLDALQPGAFGDENDGFASKEAERLYLSPLLFPERPYHRLVYMSGRPIGPSADCPRRCGRSYSYGPEKTIKSNRRPYGS